MKKIKIYSSIVLILGLTLVLLSVLVPIIKFSNYTSQNGSIGIIGGADGPTAIYLISRLLGEHLLFALILGLTLFLCGGFCLIFKRVVINNCRLKTTALSLVISLSGASGLTRLTIWYSIVVFNEVSKSPISYPLSILGGLVSLLAFVISIVLYIRVRKNIMSVKGMLFDALASVIFLPIFFFLFLKIYEFIA